MAAISIRIENLEQIRHYLSTRPEAMRRELAKAIQKSALIVQRRARQETPVDKGLLRSSIGVRLSATQAVVSPNKKYALYVHEGTGIYARAGDGRRTPWVYKRRDGRFVRTRGQRANPFMERAAKRATPDVNGAFVRAVQRVAEGA